MNSLQKTKKHISRLGCVFSLREATESSWFEPLVFADPNFGCSFRGLLLYAQIGNAVERAPGLVVYCDGSMMGVGVFQREDSVSAHLISPRGSKWKELVAIFSQYLLEQNLVDRIYVRHITETDAKKLDNDAFLVVDQELGWCHGATLEDETHNHRLVDLDEVLASDNTPKTLDGTESKNFRSKFRSAFLRFSNFLDRNDLKFELQPMVSNLQFESAVKLVEKHFSQLELAEKAIGSSALDYENLLTNHCSDSSNSLSVLGYLVGKGKRIPVSVFLGEKHGAEHGGLYCTITDRYPDVLEEFGITDSTGFSAIAQYAFARVFALAREKGWRCIDLGGSETMDLDRFKRQMGAREFITTWRVCTKVQLPGLTQLVKNLSVRHPELSSAFSYSKEFDAAERFQDTQEAYDPAPSPLTVDVLTN